jgi:hypothetical protein
MKRRRSSAASVPCWGILREIEHSPGREADDAAILEAVGRRLDEAGSEVLVEYRQPGALTGRETALPALAFSMSEGLPALDALSRWERRGVVVVNTPRAVANTHRERMIPLLEGGGVPMPESRILECSGPVPAGAEDDALFAGCWIKQATEHKTREGDVVFASDRSGVRAGLARLADRKQPRAVVQRHVEGDLVKFYGVSSEGSDAPSPAWFEWFHPKEHPVTGHRFDPGGLRDIASRCARSLGLDVWGGDAIVTSDGSIFVIDVNAWPSFALYREQAADHIAAHLAARLRRLARVAV